jgi:hypothetical protein
LGNDLSGVYLLGQFTGVPNVDVGDPLHENVLYIGESSRERFAGRWRSFGRTAFEGKGRHRGGLRYRAIFGNDSSALWVSVLSSSTLMKGYLGLATCPFLDITGNQSTIGIDEKVLMEIDDLLVKYVERRLILLHTLAVGHRPVCNAD